MVTYMADETKAPQIENPEKNNGKRFGGNGKTDATQPTTLPTEPNPGKIGNVGKLGTQS